MDIKSLLADADVAMENHVPFITHRVQSFSAHREKAANSDSTAIISESDIYELAHVLFDDYEDEFNIDLTRSQRRQFNSQIQKDRLNRYLSTLVARLHNDSINEREKDDATEAALLHLSTKNVHAACDALMGVKNYHLMMLVAQVEQADDIFQKDITAQISAWHEQNTISEITENVRALYEVLSGNTTIAQGKSKVPAEDRATTFSISEKFGLDWLQAFCLSLWYGKKKNGTIEDAVGEFLQKLDTREETASPVSEAGRESPLWILLKLYAATADGSDLEAPSLPQALSALSDPLDCQVTFKLHHALTANMPHVKVDLDKADELAAALAYQCSAFGHVVGAIYALLHISDAARRETMVKDLLVRHAPSLPERPREQPPQIWNTLTTELKLPEQWICHAKALYFRSRNESSQELRYLIFAESWTEAHECLCRRVAPRLVIDEDFDVLHEMLSSFGDAPETHVGDWDQGGRIYLDFLVAISGGKKDDSRITLSRLQGSLSEMGARFSRRGTNLNAGGTEELEERVACMEMGRKVADLLADVFDADEEQQLERRQILELPLTADARLVQTRNLGVDYYRTVMAAAR